MFNFNHLLALCTATVYHNYCILCINKVQRVINNLQKKVFVLRSFVCGCIGNVHKYVVLHFCSVHAGVPQETNKSVQCNIVSKGTNNVTVVEH